MLVTLVMLATCSALRNWNFIWDRRTAAEIWRKSPRRMRHYSSPDRRDLAWI